MKGVEKLHDVERKKSVVKEKTARFLQLEQRERNWYFKSAV